MTNRYVESFDTYATLSQRWLSQPGFTGSATLGAVAARTGAQGLAIVNPNLANVWLHAPPDLPAKVAYIFGFAFKPTQLPGVVNSPLATTIDSITHQGSLGVTSAGALVLYRGNLGTGALVATSVRTVAVGTWYYVEFRHLVDPAAGLLEVRVDGTVWATIGGNTQASANSIITTLGYGGLSGAGAGNRLNFYTDDVYVNDTGGVINNDYWGNTLVAGLVPNGPGFYTEFTTLVGAGTQWQATSEIPPDEDVSYIASPTTNQRSTFTFGNLPVRSALVRSVLVGIRAREEAAGAGAVARLYRAGGDNQGADLPVNESYDNQIEILENEPIGGTPWSVGAVNGAEIGVRNR